MPANTPISGFPYPLPTEPVAEGAAAIRALAEAAEAIGAAIVHTGSVSFNSGVFYAIPFNTVRFDPKGMFAAGAPTRLTCKVKGYYMVGAGVEWETIAQGSYRCLALTKNGTVPTADASSFAQLMGPFTSSGLCKQSVSGLVSLAVNDYVEVYGLHDRGTSIALSPRTYSPVLWAVRVGA